MGAGTHLEVDLRKDAGVGAVNHQVQQGAGSVPEHGGAAKCDGTARPRVHPGGVGGGVVVVGSRRRAPHPGARLRVGELGLAPTLLGLRQERAAGLVEAKAPVVLGGGMGVAGGELAALDLSARGRRRRPSRKPRPVPQGPQCARTWHRGGCRRLWEGCECRRVCRDGGVSRSAGGLRRRGVSPPSSCLLVRSIEPPTPPPPSPTPITHIGTARSCSSRTRCPRPRRACASLVPGPPSQRSAGPPTPRCGYAVWRRRRPLQGWTWGCKGRGAARPLLVPIRPPVEPLSALCGWAPVGKGTCWGW